MTAEELGDRMSSRELAEWSAFEQLEGPVGLERHDVNAAVVASVVANASPNRRRGQRQAKPDDFMPKWDRGPKPEPETPKTPEEERAGVMALLAASAGAPPSSGELLGPDGKPVKR